MLSTCHNGKVLDWSFKNSSDGVYDFYIGDIRIGRVFRQGRYNWSVVSNIPYKLNPDGFRSRYAAATYMLDLWRGEEIKKNITSFHKECYGCTPKDLLWCNTCHNTLTKLKALEKNEI